MFLDDSCISRYNMPGVIILKQHWTAVRDLAPAIP